MDDTPLVKAKARPKAKAKHFISLSSERSSAAMRSEEEKGEKEKRTAAEHSQRRKDWWQMFGVATATDHSQLDAAARQETTLVPRVVSIGSVMLSRPAHNDPVTIEAQIIMLVDKFPEFGIALSVDRSCAHL